MRVHPTSQFVTHSGVPVALASWNHTIQNQALQARASDGSPDEDDDDDDELMMDYNHISF